MTNLNRSLRALALGAAALLLVSGPLATDANAIHAEDTPEWAAPEGFFIEPEAILMSFDNSNLAYASATSAAGSTATAHLDDDYELGFRFGIGYRWQNRWSITFRWMSLDNEEAGSASTSTGGLLFNLVSEGGNAGDTAEVEARSDRDLDIIDLEIGRTWGDLDGHHMKMFFGPRFLQYDEILTAATFDGADLMDWGTRELDADAFGVRVGIEGHVALGRDTGWSFFGRAALSALMTDVDTFRAFADDNRFGGNDDDDLDSDDIEATEIEGFDETTLGLEAALGFQWAHTFHSDWTFHVKFGWEVANYTDVAWSSGNGSDDLGLDGAFLQLGFTW